MENFRIGTYLYHSRRAVSSRIEGLGKDFLQAGGSAGAVPGVPAGHQWTVTCTRPGLGADASRESQWCHANRTGRSPPADPHPTVKTLRPAAPKEYIPSSFPETFLKNLQKFLQSGVVRSERRERQPEIRQASRSHFDRWLSPSQRSSPRAGP